jgi:hydroxymethylglutaryl-CoA lyase
MREKPNSIRLIEVGPRDGLQNEKTVIDTKDKLTFISMLKDAGLRELEVASFVRADKIPQMSDAKDLCDQLDWADDPRYVVLVPNLKGLELAMLAKVREIAVFTATSETFNQNNINATISKSLERIRPVCEQARDNKIKIRGYISTAFGCPYEGKTSPKRIVELSHELFKLGAHEISLGDTIGVAEPYQVQAILKMLAQDFDLSKFALHFHDTRGRALANILSGLDNGVTAFDCSAGGLGGCPYAKGATGNVATEDIVDCFETAGVATGVDFKKLCEASDFMAQKLNKPPVSKAYQAYKARGVS